MNEPPANTNHAGRARRGGTACISVTALLLLFVGSDAWSSGSAKPTPLALQVPAAAQTDPLAQEALQLFEQGVQLIKEEKYADAVEVLEKALSVQQRVIPPNPGGLSSTRTVLGRAHWSLAQEMIVRKEYPSARTVLQKGLEVLKVNSHANALDIGFCKFLLAKIDSDIGDHATAAENGLEAVKLLESDKRSPKEAITAVAGILTVSCFKDANRLWEAKKYQEALDRYQQAYTAVVKFQGKEAEHTTFIAEQVISHRMDYAATLLNIDLEAAVTQLEMGRDIAVAQFGAGSTIAGDREYDLFLTHYAGAIKAVEVDDVERALRHCQAALHLAHKNYKVKAVERGAVASYAGYVCILQGRLLIAKSFLDQAQSCFLSVADRNTKEYARFCHHLAFWNSRGGHVEDAYEYYRRAVATFANLKGADYDEEAADAITTLATFCANHGRQREALKNCRDAVKRLGGKRSMSHPASYARARALYGTICAILDNHKEAASAYNDARAAFNKTNDRTSDDYLSFLYNLMAFYVQTRDQRAYMIVEELRPLLDTRPRDGNSRFVISYLVGILGMMNDTDLPPALYPKYESLFQITNAIIERDAKHAPEASIALHNNIGMYYRRKGDTSDAIYHLREAEKAVRQSGLDTDPEFVPILLNLSAAYLDSGKVVEALHLAGDAMRSQMRSVNDIFRVSSESDMLACSTASTLAFAHWMDMLLKQGKLNPEQTADAFVWSANRVGAIQDGLVRFTSFTRLIARDTTLASLAKQKVALSNEQRELQLRPPQEMSDASIQARLSEVTKQRNDLEARLMTAMSERGLTGKRTPTSLAQLRRCLPTKAALILFVNVPAIRDDSQPEKKRQQTEGQYAAFVVPAGRGAPSLIRLGSAPDIEKAIRRFRLQFTQYEDDIVHDEAKKDQLYREAATDLYRRTFARLVTALNGARTIYVIEDGELNRVPLEILTDTNGSFLVEKYVFFYLTTIDEIVHRNSRENKDGGTALLIGNPDFDYVFSHQSGALDAKVVSDQRYSVGHVKGLGWTVQELTAIRPIVSRLTGRRPTVLMRQDANRYALLSAKSPKILHVATHAFFEGNPALRMPAVVPAVATRNQDGQVLLSTRERIRGAENPLLRSGLLLAGINQRQYGDQGLVTADEIIQMDLHGTDLVVLSACDSGIGDVRIGEGVYGLRRAFLYAGAKTLILSLFEVSDKQASKLMSCFYRNLSKRKSSGEALREAQITLLQDRRRRRQSIHPFRWGGFITVGAP